MNTHRSKRCFVCKQEGCWSTKHTLEEREAEKKRYRDRLPPERMKSINQYIAEYEGFEPDEDERDDFESFVQEFEHAEAFTTSPIETEEFMASVVNNLNDAATKYTVTKEIAVATDNQDPFSYTTSAVPINRYDSDIFRGILIDTGAAKISTGGHGQFKAYVKCVDSDAVMDTNTAGNVRIQFGVGSAISVGTLRVDTPIGVVDFHILDKNTPFSVV